MAPSAIQDMPIDESVRLQPTKIFYIVPKSLMANETSVYDVTEQLLESYHDDFNPEFHAAAKKLASSSTTPYVSLSWNNWFSTAHMVVSDSKGNRLAEWSAPTKFFAYGIANIKFPEDSPHCSHPLTCSPISIKSRSQSFVKDSVTYMWGAERRDNAGSISLYKAGAKKRVEVARFQSDSGNSVAGGPLAVETREIDELVALLTCLAVLNRQ